MNRVDIIRKQQWDKITVNHLMEFYIESQALGERFDEFLLDTARKENESTEVHTMSTNEVDQLRQCIREARSHVVRQQFAGKHKQDRLDAVEWLERWGELIATLTIAKR